jgi:hypothetical protein
MTLPVLRGLLIATTVLSFGNIARADEAPVAPPTSVPAPPASTPVASPSTPPTADAPRVSLAGASLRVTDTTGTTDVALGCEGRAVLRVGARIYVACGASGVVVLTLEHAPGAAVEGRIAVEGEAVGLFVLRDEPWVEVAHTDARPLSRAKIAASWPSTVPSVPAAPTPKGVNEPAAEAKPTEPTKGSRLAPSRVGDVFELSLGASAFLTVGNLGVGGIGHGSFVRRFDAPVALRAEVSPFAFGTGKGGSSAVATAVGMVSLDTAIFELGLGLGGAAVPGRVNYEDTASGTFGVRSVSDTTTVVVPTFARFGARDGLSLAFRTNVTVRNEAFAFGSIDVLGQIPIADRWALLLHGGGGEMGWGQGDIAMRYRLTETRAAGAAYITGGAGYAFVEGSPTCQSVPSVSSTYTSCNRPQFHGPALALAGEWRF